ncbi:ribonuclease HI [Ferrithrix thermotolerans DSM 19514]|uniref:ribonuclease H n=1 Tax=Ferrithrix thermotolerans DSM 19514 TaxID=1121881 RepID=A0A1M4V7F9_9ACTN|nr:ribonuclease H [Ferrithrix thermotolerans]SHE64905.1 ribonuclease HI [Ferrithrix thermotolerans DSM 19514]
MIRVFTDGACLGNPGPGGWAWIVDDDHYDSGAEIMTTNQRMELTAVINALKNVLGDVIVVSDSTYVVNCFKDAWWKRWVKNGWRNSKGDPVANADLWKELIPMATNPSRKVEFEWVKGHSGNPLNERADSLAQRAALEVSS